MKPESYLIPGAHVDAELDTDSCVFGFTSQKFNHRGDMTDAN